MCEDATKTDQLVELHVEERSYGKEVTVVSGFDPNKTDLDNLSSELKSKFACGGTVSENGGTVQIELQGDHLGRARDEMESRGFEVEEN